MTLYLLRHAIALERSHWKKKDSDRPLTKEGINKFRKVARGLKHLDLSPDAILTSPYKRALETAFMAATALKAKKKLEIVDALAAEADPRQAIEYVMQHYSAKHSVMLVGHEPYLSELASVLLGADKPLGLDFKKGGLCRLETEKLLYGRCATLQWWLPPKLLKRI